MTTFLIKLVSNSSFFELLHCFHLHKVCFWPKLLLTDQHADYEVKLKFTKLYMYNNLPYIYKITKSNVLYTLYKQHWQYVTVGMSHLSRKNPHSLKLSLV